MDQNLNKQKYTAPLGALNLGRMMMLMSGTLFEYASRSPQDNAFRHLPCGVNTYMFSSKNRITLGRRSLISS